MSTQSSAVPHDDEADRQVQKTCRCSYCRHELKPHEDTCPCPHCGEFAFEVRD